MLTKKYTDSDDNSECDLIFRCIETIFNNFPDFLKGNNSVLNCWVFILKKICKYFQLKSTRNEI